MITLEEVPTPSRLSDQPRLHWPHAVVALVTIGAGMAFLSQADARAAGGYGLISAFPVGAWVCLAVLTVSFVAALYWRPDDMVVPLLHVVGLVLLLDGAAPLSENAARWSISWYTAGFVNQINSAGVVLAHTDARWSWPGFFAGAAALLRPAGIPNADQLLLWTPVVLSMAYLAPLMAIARSVTASRRAPWLALWVFTGANWTQQSYFSPQGVIFLLFLISVALALHFFGHRAGEVAQATGLSCRRRVSSLSARASRLAAHIRRTAKFEDVAAVTSRGQRIGALVVLLVLMAASTVSHQLTPVALFLDLGVLALLGRLRARSLPVLLAAMIFLYISYFATDFWSGHFSQLIGIGGGGGSSFSQNVGQRIVGAQAHRIVVYLRLLFTASIWVLAAAGALRRLRRGRADVTTVCLFATPLILPVVQPYGGEALIRAFLYGLPFAAILVASALLPSGRKLRSWAALAAVLLVAIPVYVVAAYGNEQFEEIRPNEVAAVTWFYAHAVDGSVLLALEPDVPGPTEKLATDPWITLSGPITTPAIVKSLQKQKVPAYVVLTASQQDYGIINDGLAPGWEQQIQSQLSARPDLRVVFQKPDATIFQYVPG